jgi:tetratricopeptide (TPR) repeat protein
MKTITRTKIILICLLALSLGAPMVHADNPAQVKALLEQALKLYSEKQYVRALDLFKQAQELDPSNATAEEYVRNTKQRILEWEMQGDDKDKAAKQVQPTWDNLTSNKAGYDDNAANARDLIAARRSLVEKMRNRSTSTDNIVQIQDNGKGLEVTLFHDQLFLPGLQTLRDEALPVLANVSDLIRTGEDRPITIHCASHVGSEDQYMLYSDFPNPAPDPTLPHLKPNETAMMFQDIETTRAMILFTYIAQKSINKTAAAE